MLLSLNLIYFNFLSNLQAKEAKDIASVAYEKLASSPQLQLKEVNKNTQSQQQ